MDVNDLLARVVVLTLFLGLSQADSVTKSGLNSSYNVTCDDDSTSENLTASSNSNNEDSALVLKVTTPAGTIEQHQVIVNFSMGHVQRLQECICSDSNLGCKIELDQNFTISSISGKCGVKEPSITTWQCNMTLDQFSNRVSCFKVQDATSRCTVNKNACHVFSHLNVYCNQSYYSVSWNSSQTVELAFVNDDFVNVTYCNDDCPGSDSTKGNPNDHEGSEDSTPIIVGVVLGTAALVLVIAFGIVLYRRKKKARFVSRKYQVKTKILSTSESDIQHSRSGANKCENLNYSNNYSTIDKSRNEDVPKATTLSTKVSSQHVNDNYKSVDAVKPNPSENKVIDDTVVARSSHLYSKLGEKVQHLDQPYDTFATCDDSSHDVVGATKSTNRNGDTCVPVQSDVVLESSQGDEPINVDNGSNDNTTMVHSEGKLPKTKFRIVDKGGKHHDYFELEKIEEADDSEQEKNDNKENNNIDDVIQTLNAPSREETETEAGDVEELDGKCIHIENDRKNSDV